MDRETRQTRSPEPEILEEIEAAVHPVVEAAGNVLGLYLFGSQITGDARPDSDVDLGVLFDKRGTLEEVVALEERLERALGRSVDLVDVGRCEPFLAARIVQGERVYERSALRCDEFDLYALRRAGDLAHHERERRKLILRQGGR